MGSGSVPNVIVDKDQDSDDDDDQFVAKEEETPLTSEISQVKKAL